MYVYSLPTKIAREIWISAGLEANCEKCIKENYPFVLSVDVDLTQTPTIVVTLEKESDKLFFLLKHSTEKIPEPVIDAAFNCPYVPLQFSSTSTITSHIGFVTRYGIFKIP